MALIECPDCRSEMSDLADACMRCGRPLRDSTILSGLAKVAFMIFSAVMATGWLLHVSGTLFISLDGVGVIWATGAVILGMIFLVARRRLRFGPPAAAAARDPKEGARKPPPRDEIDDGSK